MERIPAWKYKTSKCMDQQIRYFLRVPLCSPDRPLAPLSIGIAGLHCSAQFKYLQWADYVNKSDNLVAWGQDGSAVLQPSGFGLESSVMKCIQRAQTKSLLWQGSRATHRAMEQHSKVESRLGTVKGKLRLSFPCLGCLGPGVFRVWGIFWILEYFQTFLHWNAKSTLKSEVSSRF